MDDASDARGRFLLAGGVVAGLVLVAGAAAVQVHRARADRAAERARLLAAAAAAPGLERKAALLAAAGATHPEARAALPAEPAVDRPSDGPMADEVALFCLGLHGREAIPGAGAGGPGPAARWAAWRLPDGEREPGGPAWVGLRWDRSGAVSAFRAWDPVRFPPATPGGAAEPGAAADRAGGTRFDR